MKRSQMLVFSSLLIPVIAGCPASDDSEDTGAATGASEGSGSGGPDGGTSAGTSGGPGESTSDGGTSADSSGGAVDTTGGTTGGGSGLTCNDATLYAGDPYFNGDFSGWHPSGHPLQGDTPLRSRNLAEYDGRVLINTQSEIWVADDTQAVRLAGNENASPLQYTVNVPCDQSAFITIQGVAALPGGNIVLADSTGNGLVELSDPEGDCTASVIAGNAENAIAAEISEGIAGIGDVDGPGVDARFAGVQLPIVDAAGNIYVVDAFNYKIKRVGNDADRTVTTLGSFPADSVIFAMTELNGTVYATGSTGAADFILAYDATTPGDPSVLFQGTGLFDVLDSSTQSVFAGIATDGVDLLLASAKGYVFRVSTSGDPLEVIAGTGNISDIPDLDLTMPVPLDQLPLRTYSLARQILTRHGDAFLYAASDGGIGYHIWSINCG